MLKKRSLIAVSGLLIAGLLTGGGTQASANDKPTKNLLMIPAFTKDLGVAVGTPNSTFNDLTVKSGLYDHMKAMTADGRRVILNAQQQPLLFEAYWCPHCQRTLVLLDQSRSQLRRLPVVVSVGYFAGTSLAKAVQISREEMTELHLKGFTVDYILAPDAGVKYAGHGYPTLAFYTGGKLLTLSGEHTLAVWKRALNG